LTGDGRGEVPSRFLQRIREYPNAGHRIHSGYIVIKPARPQNLPGRIRYGVPGIPRQVDISPLEIINMWLEEGLISWDDVKHGYLSEWDRLEEPRQPIKAIGKFQQFTGKIYSGS